MSLYSKIGQFEQLTLAAILELGDNAYGVTIHETVERLAAARTVSIGAVYATLDRLEDKRLIASWLSDPTPERGGRSKRHYKLEAAGERALRESVLASKRVCESVERVWGRNIWNAKPVRQH